MAKRLKWDNVDAVGEKCFRNDGGNLILTVEDKRKAWQSHYQKLLNVEFPWNASNLNDETPAEGPAFIITTEIVSKAINKMKAGKAARPSGIAIEKTKAANIGITGCITSFFNHILYKGRVTNE